MLGFGRNRPEDEFRRGLRVVRKKLPEGYTPPSASMDPAATVTDWPKRS